MPRCFIAVNVNDEIKDKALDISKYISGTGRFNFVDKDHMHLTVKFLGDVDSVDSIIEKLRTVSMESFIIEVKDIGLFQNRGQINVIWLGISDNGNLSTLNERINDNLGITEDRKYVPHFTLARVKECDDGKLFDILKKYKNMKFGEVHVKEFVLYKSTLLQMDQFMRLLRGFLYARSCFNCHSSLHFLYFFSI